MSGESGSAVYHFKNGERLNTGSPIFVQGKPTYFIWIITPTNTIYSAIENVLFTQRTETFSLLAGTTAAIVMLIVFLSKWSKLLGTEVKRRTRELEESYDEIKSYLEKVLKETRGSKLSTDAATNKK